MLTNLEISNIVLIEKLHLEFGHGLNVLTGETGAGKSILLDALSLALGARSDTGLVRHDCDTASVIAEFDGFNENIRNILSENDIDIEKDIILRRTLTCDGKSRAWINGIPVSVKTLKQVGDELIEIHGQFANHTLLNQTNHRGALDTFGATTYPEYAELLNSTKLAFNQYNIARKKLITLTETLEKSAAEKEFLEHNVAQLAELNTQIGEEAELSTRRISMMNAEKDLAILSDATAGLSARGNSLDGQIFAVAHTLEKIKTEPNPYQEQIDKLYEAAEIISDVAQNLSPTDVDIDDLDTIEQRLFAIRSAARKYRVHADELSEKLSEMTAQLNLINDSDAELKKITTLVEITQRDFDALANKLSIARQNTANTLRTRLLQELPDLKLGQADFQTNITPTDANSTGRDNIAFMIKTNPGTPFAELNKAASGGELARLMLAMRVILSNNNENHTFVFDEIDTGISGATASAVGLRLHKLANSGQALVITHSAQVAGFADKHFKIEKSVNADKTITSVSEITNDNRLNEIARIISGAEITPESLATAKTLIKN